MTAQSVSCVHVARVSVSRSLWTSTPNSCGCPYHRPPGPTHKNQVPAVPPAPSRELLPPALSEPDYYKIRIFQTWSISVVTNLLALWARWMAESVHGPDPFWGQSMGLIPWWRALAICHSDPYFQISRPLGSLQAGWHCFMGWGVEHPYSIAIT